MTAIAIINGPNLNLLGSRETHHYGIQNLDTINNDLKRAFAAHATLEFFQSNHEGTLIDHMQGLRNVLGIVINPGAFTHTSIAIRDTLLAIKIPTVEVHLSNIFRREEFRKHSFFSDISIGVISGFGPLGYHFGIQALLEHLKRNAA
jgi:3-dehydroquinate dehydratase-2